MKKGKKKPMSMAQRKAREESRQQLRAEGVLPPKKKPLNRKMFIEEAKAAFKDELDPLTRAAYIMQAVGWMLNTRKPTLEDVGIAKLLKVTCEIKQFEDEKREAGQATYQMSELYDRLQHIFNA